MKKRKPSKKHVTLKNPFSKVNYPYEVGVKLYYYAGHKGDEYKNSIKVHIIQWSSTYRYCVEFMMAWVMGCVSGQILLFLLVT